MFSFYDTPVRRHLRRGRGWPIPVLRLVVSLKTFNRDFSYFQALIGGEECNGCRIDHLAAGTCTSAYPEIRYETGNDPIRSMSYKAISLL